MKNNLKSILLAAVIVCIASIVVVTALNRGNEETDKEAGSKEKTGYPYTFFAASQDEGAITINSGETEINGDLCTNGTIVSEKKMNITGETIEHANEEIVDIHAKLCSRYVDEYSTEGVFEKDFEEKTDINITSPVTEEQIKLQGNIKVTTGMLVVQNIELDGDITNTDEAVMYTLSGNITIHGTDVNLNGLVYAPKGTVKITAKNLNMDHVIVIADKIIIESDSMTANYSREVAESVGAIAAKEVRIFADGVYKKETKSIEITWESNCPNSKYQIMSSDDNKNYSLEAEVTNTTTYSYVIKNEFDIKYMKVVVKGKNGENGESVPFVVRKDGTEYVAELLDSDQDGLDDWTEKIIGTDVNNPDTDGDGLTDYDERERTSTDPTKFDSVEKGVSDADVDSDKDGISNKDEISMKTYPGTADSDEDGLYDGEEVNTYHTDPLKPNKDIKIKRTISEEIDSEEKKEITKVSVTMEGTGNIEEATEIENLYGIDVQSSQVVGLVGVPVEISTTADISKATITFSYDESKLGDTKESDLRVMWYNEKEQFFNIMEEESVLDQKNNTVSYTTNHLGTYLVVDRKAWYDVWGIDISE